MPAIPAQLLKHTTAHTEWAHRLLRDLVLLESPSESPAHVNLASMAVAAHAQDLGGQAAWHRQSIFGDVLELRFGPRKQGSGQVLLLGHLDTVWPVGTLATMPWRQTDTRFWGPGVLDMKAGIVIALLALKTLQSSGLNPSATLLLNSDEEVGSPVSRPITERLASASSAVFVLEPAQGLAYKTARKGVGHFTLTVKGVAAHAGVDFEQGHSAIRELAKLIETVSQFTDRSKSRTVNCGVVHGGTRSNVVAAEAYAEVDVRIATAEDEQTVDCLFRSLTCADPHCRLEVAGGINRPPMERTRASAALFHRARSIAAELGFDLDEASTGGGSDGNFTSALGVPTLDGMGAVGEGAHATHESVFIEHLVPRASLLAAMIAEA